MDPSRICILTLVIGADYKRNLSEALASKRAYAQRHGYTYIELGEEWWNRDRPIAWSKVPAWIHYSGLVEQYDYLWLSDADVYITNPGLRLEDHVLSVLGSGKNLLMTLDACGHINSGNMIVRTGGWAVNFFRRVWAEESCINHIWWENAAIIKVGAEPSYDAAIDVTLQSWRFNSYVMGLPGRRLWLPGDFLVHFAGVYDSTLMNTMIKAIKGGKTPRLNMHNPKAESLRFL
jgi:hypothetical protein